MLKGFFYSHYNADPFYNMGFDEWMFTEALKTPSLVILRLYTWNEGAITFGYNQKQDTALDFTKIGTTPIIRRITGGRALYHDPSELTYSIAVNTNGLQNHILNGSISETSQNIAEILVSFLDRTGIKSHYMRKSSKENSKPDFFHKAACFESYAKNEILNGENKVIASAQKRLNQTLLQHGSIKIKGAASHPALNTEDVNPLSDIDQMLKENEFNDFAKMFLSAFNENTGIDFQQNIIHDEYKLSIENVVKSVQKNALLKREYN